MGKKIWYIPGEVVIHNKPTDCWVSLRGRILDLTPLIAELTTENNTEKDKETTEKHKDKAEKTKEDKIEKMPVYDQAAKIIIAFAGKDISHWFKKDECQLKMYVHPVISASFPYSPHGLRPDQRILAPSTAWRPIPDPPWWEDTKYDVGRVTKNVRPIKITNMLTSSVVQINVCEEETIYEIMEFRYGPWYNRHYSSYTWCYMGKRLCLNHTLTKNGILDERDRFEKYNLPEDTYVPNIQLYYNDDLTITCPHQLTGPCPKNCECFNPKPVTPT